MDNVALLELLSTHFGTNDPAALAVALRHLADQLDPNTVRHARQRHRALRRLRRRPRAQ